MLSYTFLHVNFLNCGIIKYDDVSFANFLSQENLCFLKISYSVLGFWKVSYLNFHLKELDMKFSVLGMSLG